MHCGMCASTFTHTNVHTHPLVTKLHPHFPLLSSRERSEGVVIKLTQQGLMLEHPSPHSSHAASSWLRGLWLLGLDLAASEERQQRCVHSTGLLEGAVLACEDDILTSTLISIYTVPGFHFSQQRGKAEALSEDTSLTDSFGIW